MNAEKRARLQSLPQVHVLLDEERVATLIDAYGRWAVLDGIRASLDFERAAILDGRSENGFALDAFLDRLEARLAAGMAPSLRSVLNATGVIVHTNLGRAPLSEAALENLIRVAWGYGNVEYNVDHGSRGSRLAHVEGLIRELTGAEGALVVNNNAAAVLLALNTFAMDAGVIVSRGELVEIGGSFRIPEVVKRGMAKLVEVGTTNKTRVGDYREAISDEARVLLKVHPSNYKVVGFTASVSREELAGLARERDALFIEDLGSGAMIDLAQFGLPHETTIAEAIAAGVDVVTASGDKLLGGPQCGIVAGKKDAIAAMKKNPLMRALRVDKLCLAALEETLSQYRNPDRAMTDIPVLRMMSATLESIRQRAEALAVSFHGQMLFTVEVKEGISYVGGGALPDEGIATALVCVTHAKLSADELTAALRRNSPPIIARIHEDQVVIDLRTVRDWEDDLIARALLDIA